MPTVWLLIIFFGAGADGGRFISQPIEFRTEERCNLAVAKIKDEAYNRSGWQPYAICVAK